MGHSPLPQPRRFPHRLLITASVWGISHRFRWLSPSEGQVSHVLLTRAPLSTCSKTGFSFDLHVLGTPPAFILSQDQTLRRELILKLSLLTGRLDRCQGLAWVLRFHSRTLSKNSARGFLSLCCW